jgi:hypothetical protein
LLIGDGHDDAGMVYGRQIHGRPYAASFPTDKIDA